MTLEEERADLVEGEVVVTRASKAVPAAMATVIIIAGLLVLEEEVLGKQGQVEVTVWRETVVTDTSYPLPRLCQNLLQAGVLEH